MNISPTVWVAIIAAIPGTIGSILGVLNRGKIQEVHMLINSRMTELLEATRSGAFAAGQQDRENKENHTP